MSDTVHVRSESGALMYFAGAALPPGIADRIRKGDLVRVTEDGEPWHEAAGNAEALADAGPAAGERDEPGPEDGPGAGAPAAPPLPAAREARAVWADFAVSQGMDRAEAGSLTKAQLIEKLTTAPPAP
jgi:hypothetical protein